jgi:hypothetical protein
VIDPDERRARSYSPVRPGGVLADELRTDNPPLELTLAQVFSALD